MIRIFKPKEDSSFFSVYSLAFIKPGLAIEKALRHTHGLKYGFLSLLVPVVGYSLFYAMAYKAGGAPSTFKPWLALPIEKYFFYDIFLTLPGYFVSFLVAGGTVHLLAKVMGGRGTYEGTLTVLGLGIGVASWSAMIHDLTDAFLSFIGVIDMGEYEKALNSPTIWRIIWLIFYTGYFIWFPILFTKGILKAQQLSLVKSISLAVVGFIIFQVTLLIFIR